MEEINVQEVLADLPQEDEAVETETPTVTPAEENQPETPVEEPAEEGENTPTEEDDDLKERTSKRVQKLLQDRAIEKERADALEERLAALESRTETKGEEIPERWLKLYSTGDEQQDQFAYQEWKALNEEQRVAIKEELVAEMRSKEQQEEEETERMTAEYDSMMDELEAEGKDFDRNTLMKFMTDVPGGLWTTDGKPNFALGLRLMEADKTPSVKSQVKKTLGAIKPNQGFSGKEFFNPEDFSGFKPN
jgi:hypothetical protein